MLNSRSRCLVTGGAGFIGSHLATALVERGHRVRVVDNLSTGHLSNLANVMDRVEFLEGDLCAPAVARAAVEDIDVVFHLAALPSVPLSFEEPWRSHDANCNATMRLLEAGLDGHVSRFVYASSCAVYGDSPVNPKRESMPAEAMSPYAASKLASEQYVLAFARAGKLSGVALRYFNVFGPRQDPDSPYSAVIPLFLRAVGQEEPVTIYGDGEQTRDFVYVGDVVQANLLAAGEGAATGSALNVASGSQTSLRTLLAIIGAVTHSKPSREFAPRRPGDVLHSGADISLATAVLGYHPETSLEEGLRNTWESMRPVFA